MRAFIAASVLLLTAAPVSAATIDFTSAEAAVLDGQASEHATIDGVGLTATAAPQGATIEQSSAGLGVNYWDPWTGSPYQIEGSELLTISFDDPQMITGFTVTNLYNWGTFQIEVGEYTIDGSNYQQFVAQNANGLLAIDLGSVESDKIAFRADGSWTGWSSSGFSVRSITTGAAAATHAPELDPGTMRGALAVVLGGALVMRDRRRRARA